MYSIIEVYDQISIIENQLKNLVGIDIKFDSTGSVFADRHPMDLRTAYLDLKRDKDIIDHAYLTLLKLKKLKAIDFEIKALPDSKQQFIIYQVDPNVLKTITANDLMSLRVEVESNEIDIHRTEISEQMREKKYCYLMPKLKQQLRDQAASNYKIEVSNLDFIKENNQIVQRFCSLFNMSPQKIDENEAYRKCFAYFAAGIINIKNLKVEHYTDEHFNTYQKVINVQEVQSSNDIQLKNNKDIITRLTIYGISYDNELTSAVMLNNQLAIKFAQEAQRRFSFLFNSTYHTRTKVKADFDKELQEQYMNSTSKQTIVAIRGSNSTPNNIVFAFCNENGVKSLLAEIVFNTNSVNIYIEYKNLSPGEWHYSYTYNDNIDKFVNDFSKVLGLVKGNQDTLAPAKQSRYSNKLFDNQNNVHPSPLVSDRLEDRPISNVFTKSLNH